MLPTLLLQRLARCSLGIPNALRFAGGVVAEMGFPAATGLPNAFDIGIDTRRARDTRSFEDKGLLVFYINNMVYGGEFYPALVAVQLLEAGDVRTQHL